METLTTTGPRHDGGPVGQKRSSPTMPSATRTERRTGTMTFTSSEGLRALLTRLHDAGPEGWKRDPIAAELMEFVANKYASLARKHGLDRWEAASAAFDVMRTKAARCADDPWAVITHAVRITCIAEERAQGLLCSTHQARRPHVSAFHDAERFGDRTNPLIDYHPAFRVNDDLDEGDEPPADTNIALPAEAAVNEAIRLFTVLGWPSETARAAVEHVAVALARSGNRHSVYETLRRDKHARAILDLSAGSWAAVLKTLLGHPHPAYASTSAGRGVLLRLIIGESLPLLLHDDDLVLTVSLSAPGRGGGRSR